MKKRPRRNFSDDFKRQVVELYHHGKRKYDILREYDIYNSVLDKWIRQFENSGLFKEKDNRSDLENELIRVKKRNTELEIENEILKQAALIMGRKSK